MILTLPYPPSVNTYWRHPTKGRLAGRHLISEKGRAYRQHVMACSAGALTMQGRLAVMVRLFPPDRRRRDIDNALKALLDAMGSAGIYADDSQIDDLRVVRCEVDKPGRAEVELQEMT